MSPVTIRSRSGGTPTAVAATCEMTASIPCPCSVAPVATKTFPFASSRMVAPSWAEMRAPPTP